MPDAKETNETDSSAVAESQAAVETFVDSGAGEPDRLERLWAVSYTHLTLPTKRKV